jgi:hypothetical protein
VAGAMHLDDDTFWHLGIVLTVHSEFPRQDMLLSFCLKEHQNRITVKFSTEGVPRLIDLADDKQLFEFYDDVVTQLKSYLDSNLDTLLRGMKTSQKIGFLTDLRPTLALAAEIIEDEKKAGT